MAGRMVVWPPEGVNYWVDPTAGVLSRDEFLARSNLSTLDAHLSTENPEPYVEAFAVLIGF
jgi:hypothetical protein